MNYYFDDFTEKNYYRLLDIAKQTKKFVSYDTALEGGEGMTNCIILRHDVDMSINRAEVLAKIEKEVSVSTTYFIYLHSIFYSILEKKTGDLIKSIVSQGHFIGLHFEPAFYGLNPQDVDIFESYINRERLLLEDIAETKVNYISYHNPDIGGNWCSLDDNVVCGLINAYGKYFRQNYKYCSDSNGYWRFDRLEDIIKSDSYNRLHVLLHPVWWQKEPMSPYDRVKRCVNDRKENTLCEYETLLRDNGRVNVIN